MTLDDLLQEKKIQSYAAKPLEIQQLLSVAIRDLGTASRNLTADPDWAYNIAYNAVLQSARALMMSAGYRPRGFDHHSTVVRFTEGVFGKNQTIPIAVLATLLIRQENWPVRSLELWNSYDGVLQEMRRN
jgi:hypothetical protein